MVKSLIKGHLNTLLGNKNKGIEIDVYSRISEDLRHKLDSITSCHELTSQSWNTALQSQILIDFTNKATVDDETLNFLFSAEEELAEKEEVTKSNYINEVYQAIQTKIQETESSYTYYNRQFKRKSSSVFMDVLLYFMDYSFDENEIMNLINACNEIRENHLNDYIEFKRNRTHFLKFKNYPYVNHIGNIYDHFQKHNQDFEFFQVIFDSLGEKSHAASEILLTISLSLLGAKDREKMKENISKLYETFDKELASNWLSQLAFNRNSFILDNECHRLLQNSQHHSNEDVYAIIYGENSINHLLLSAARSWDDWFKINFIKNCISKKKKGFLRLLSENLELFEVIGRDSILFKERFAEIVNLNTLNKSNLEDLSKMKQERKLNQINEGITLTFNELKYLYDQKSSINTRVFYGLKELPVDQRLKVCKELPEKHLIQEQIITDENEEQPKNSYVEQIISLLKVKPLSRWAKELDYKIKFVGSEHYLVLLTKKHNFEPFKEEIETATDIEFILNNEKIMEVAHSLKEAKVYFCEKDKSTQFLIKELGITREFIKEHSESIVKFSEKGLAHVFYTLHHGKKQSAEQLKNLNLVTKAELVGKLDQIKFVDEDFELEIGMKISDSVKNVWKKNSQLKSSYTIEETYAYEHTIRIGENPVTTCMHWNDGMYSRCLLSNFDTNKKLLIAKDKAGRIVARAILRLTKGTNKVVKTVGTKRLAFRDVDDMKVTPNNSKPEATKQKEELVLFLEHCYSSLDEKQAKEVRQAFVELARVKAKEINARFGTSTGYRSVAGDTMKNEQYYIFISYSKNGYQYLDSLSGQASESNEGKFMQGNIILETVQKQKEEKVLELVEQV